VELVPLQDQSLMNFLKVRATLLVLKKEVESVELTDLTLEVLIKAWKTSSLVSDKSMDLNSVKDMDQCQMPLEVVTMPAASETILQLRRVHHMEVGQLLYLISILVSELLI
jgi:hypothetical protein